MRTNPKFKIQNANPLRISSVLAGLATALLVFAQPARGQNLPTALDTTGLIWNTGCSDVWQPPWFGQTLTNHDGVDAAQSGHIGARTTNWLETTITGPGFLRFWWKVSSEANYDKLRFSVNGVEQSSISGTDDLNWHQPGFDLPPGSNTVRWSYTKDGSLDRGYDAGWVDEVQFTPGLTLADATDNTNLVWATSGGACWFPQAVTFHSDNDAVRSGALGDNETNWVRTTVIGPALYRFWWKVSSETNHDFAECYLDGALQTSLSGEVDWREQSVFVPEGAHALEWRYYKNGRGAAGADAVWLDGVKSYTPDEPFIGVQPADQTVWVGQPVTFTFQAIGAEPLTNQWRCNNMGLPDETNVTLTLPPVQVSDAGEYSVVVSNAFGRAVSSNALLTVLAGPSFAEALEAPLEMVWSSGGDAPWFTQTNTSYDNVDAAQSGTLMVGQESWLQATVPLVDPMWLSFWWLPNSGYSDRLNLEVNGTNWPTDHNYGYGSWYSNSVPLRAGSNTLRWIYEKGSSYPASSWLDEVQLTPILAPLVLAPPQDRTVLEGTPVTLTADVLGASPLNFLWTTNGVPVPGGTAGSLDLGNVTVQQAGTYSVSVSNGNGSTNLSATLTVVPFQDYTGALDSGALVWDNSCTNWPWIVQTTNTLDGDAVRSGSIPDSQTTWLQTTVTGPGRISFWWRVSSQTNYDQLIFSINGSTRAAISGETAWAFQAFDVPPGPHTLRWFYSKNSSGSSGADAAYLDRVQFTAGGTLSEALDDATLFWVAGGDASWFMQTNVTRDGADAAQSGAIGDGQTCWMEITCYCFHPVALSFWWKTSSETNGDVLCFSLDGATRTSISGETEWRQEHVYLSGGGKTHTLRWTYAKNAAGTNGLDAAWLDEVQMSTDLSALPMPPEDHLVAWYPFNGNARDASGHGNDGTIHGSPYLTSDRSYSGTTNAYRFSSGDYVDCGNGPSLSRLTNFTLAAWIYPYSVNGGTLLSKHTSDGSMNCHAEFDFYLYSDGTLMAFLGDGGASGDCNWPETLVYNGNVGKLTTYQWHHVALTVSDTRAALYLDGVYVPPVSGARDAVVLNHRQYGTRPLQIARFYNGNTGSFNGRIDEVRVYDLAVLAEEMPLVMDADVLPPCLVAVPVSITTNEAADVVLSGCALGAATLHYQWFRDTSPLHGATNATLWLSNAAPADAGAYSVIVTNSLGAVTGLVAQVTIQSLGLDAPLLSWNLGGNASWFGQTNITHDGVMAAQSGAITNSQRTWIETTLLGPGTLTYWWKVSSEAGWDGLTNILDGVAQASISGEVDWQQETLDVPLGRHTVRWTFGKDAYDYDPVGMNAGWLDQVVYTPAMSVALGDALDNTNLVWSVGGDAAWFGQTKVTHDGVDAAQSGAVTNYDGTSLETTVTGPGILSFWWKVSSEVEYDSLGFFLDGQLKGPVISGKVDWQRRVVPVAAGSHSLEWLYSKTSPDPSPGSADAGWLDEVSFVQSDKPLMGMMPEPWTAMLGDVAAFGVEAAGVAPLHYQWYRGGTALNNETNQLLWLQPVQTADVANYTVVVTNSLGRATSAPLAALTLLPMKLEWQRELGGSGDDELLTVLPTDDGGFLAGGCSSSTNGNRTGPAFGGLDAWIVRLDHAGEPQWDASFGGPTNDGLRAVASVPGGGWLLAGNSFSGVGGNKTNASFGGADMWIVCVDTNGQKRWEAEFGGSGDDQLIAAQALPDGGFLLAGSSDSPPSGNKTNVNFGLADFWVVRVDANGHKLWDRSYGGTNEDWLSAVALTPDGGFLLAGASSSPPGGNKTNVCIGDRDFWVVRADADGNKLWDAAFGGGGEDYAVALQPTADGGWLVGGSSDSGADGNKTEASYGRHDFWLVRLDANGVKQWDHTYGGIDQDYLSAMATEKDGNLLIAGQSKSDRDGCKTHYSFGDSDVWLVCVNTNGQLLWDYSFGGSGDDWPNALLATADGGVVIAANSESKPDGNKTNDWNGNKTTTWLGGPRDFWVIRLSAYPPPAGALQLVQTRCQGTDLSFSFQTQSGTSYTVEYNDDLSTTNWQVLETMTGDGSLMPCLVPMTNAMERYFRVRHP